MSFIGGMENYRTLHEQGPIVDQAHLNRMTGGDDSLASEVLGLFREQWDLWVRLLEPTTDTLDWGNAAHTIKGSARGIGAWQLGEICGKAEECARGGELTRDEKRVWLEAISNEMDAVIADIARIEHKAMMASLRG
jgi:HPt (histidine-containing phosphotransfer) domain-containing protein